MNSRYVTGGIERVLKRLRECLILYNSVFRLAPASIKIHDPEYQPDYSAIVERES